MAISIVHIVKNSIKFSFVKGISALLSLPVTIYVATVLVPEEYGEYGFLALWLMYATLIGPGIFSAGQREIPVLLGKEEEEEALRIQNTSISSEMLYLVMPFVIILAASLFYSTTVLKLGLLIVAASYVATRLSGFWGNTNFVREKFNVVAKGNLLVAVVAPLIILATINWLNVYGLLIAPLVASIVLWVYLLRTGPINYRFVFDRNETVRLLRVGIVLQGLTFAFWSFRIADRTIIAATLPLEQLGLYTFAMQFMMYALTLATDFGRVLQPILWRGAGIAESIYEGFKDTKRIAVYLALGTSIIVPMAQLGFYVVAHTITTKYADSAPIFSVLSYNLYLASMGLIPNLVLSSSIVNRQRISLLIYSIGVALNIGFDLLAVRLGYGVIGIAWVTICTQGLVTFVLYYLSKDYIFETNKEFGRFQALIVIPFLATIPFYSFHNYLYSATSSMWAFTVISLAVQTLLWSLLIGVLYRDYLSLNHIRLAIRKVNVVILQAKGKLPR